jgi:1,4-dihydroxy-2-naphthoate octaprenyltransferase
MPVERPGERTEQRPRIGDWIEELRAPFLTASIIPVIVGGAVAWWSTGSFDWQLFIITLIAIALIHLGANVTNDYWDFMGGTDRVNLQRTPFSGGSGLIVEGRLRPMPVLRLGMALLAAGSALGLVLLFVMGEGWWVVLLMGVLGVMGAYFYSAPPLSLASRGVGELLIGSLFGMFIVEGTAFVLLREFTLEAFAASIPVSLWIASVIWVNQIPDIEADAATRKRTMVVRLGPTRSVAVLAILLGLAPAALVVGVFLGYLPNAAVIALVAIGPSGMAIAVLARSHGIFPQMEPAMKWTIVAHLVGGIGLVLGLLY